MSDISNSNKNVLQEFCDSLKKKIDSNFICGAAYGSVLNKESVDIDKINFLIIVKAIDTNILDDISKTLKETKYRLDLLTLSIEDLKSSTDVFPIKFLNIKRNYLLIHGEDVLGDLEISDKYLRLRTEQELKNLMLRLRRSYILCESNKKRIISLINLAYNNLTRLLNIVIELRSGKCENLSTQDMIKLIKSYDIDVGTIDEVANFRNDKYPNDIITLKSLLSRLMKCVRDTAKFVDNL